MWSTAAGNGYTATQVIGLDYTQRSNQGDFTNVQSDMDNGQSCGKTSTFSASGKLTQTACGVLGPYSMWSPQYSALNTWSSLGSGAYHSMQWTVTKRLTSNFLMGLNYTLSKSLDIGSRVESSGVLFHGFHDQLVERPAASRRVAVRCAATGQCVFRLQAAGRPRASGSAAR